MRAGSAYAQAGSESKNQTKMSELNGDWVGGGVGDLLEVWGHKRGEGKNRE